jgi:hypothetical protein
VREGHSRMGREMLVHMRHTLQPDLGGRTLAMLST